MDKKDYYISDFISFLKENDKSPGTIKTYTDNLYLFVKYYIDTYGEDFQPKKVITMDLIDWRSFMINRGLKASTINNRIASIKEFFAFLELKGICKSPSRTIKKIKVNNTSPIVVRQNIALCNCIPKSNYNYNTNNYLVVICFFTKQIITITKLLMT